jgi:hypothetical protein
MNNLVNDFELYQKTLIEYLKFQLTETFEYLTLTVMGYSPFLVYGLFI